MKTVLLENRSLSFSSLLKLAFSVSTLMLLSSCASTDEASRDPAQDVVTDTASASFVDDSVSQPSPASLAAADLKCPRYKIYYIDPSTQFFTPPVPLEDHAEFVFCANHAGIDEIRARLKKMNPIGSQADAGSARIKVIPRGRADDAIIFCSTGEITYRGKQYRLDRRAYEPALLSLREEGDRQRALAIERESEMGTETDPRNPASLKPKK